MGKERVSQQATPTLSVGTPRTSSAGEKTGLAGQTSKGALTHDRIAQLAYELYEQRGRQEGRDFEDWLNAELQLIGVVGQS
ncbi:MAG: DUF2934 domain-containing protein [Nitrospira sp.]|nr:DUF2934 domain-containing protein [Nitrospira sp.]MDH4369198.1 DUF2934 domain-containing protein [Nitrospira sp.]